MPLRSPTPKVEFPKQGLFAYEGIARPGANRAGIFLFALVPLIEKGKQRYNQTTPVMGSMSVILPYFDRKFNHSVKWVVPKGLPFGTGKKNICLT